MIKSIEQGLDFMLSHFEGQEAIWPRNISTAYLECNQKTIGYRDLAVSHYSGSLNRDSRLACYPNYKELIKNGDLPPTYKPRPTHIFIDLDLNKLRGERKRLDKALKTTLKNIKTYFGIDAAPSILWTGGGFHVHQPIDLSDAFRKGCNTFEEVADFVRFDNPSVKFLRYAESKLTNGMSDPDHTISFNSSLTRIPGSMNIKYEEGDEDSRVKIVQRWNGIRSKPTLEFVFADFYIWLVDEGLDKKRKEMERMIRMQKHFRNGNRGAGLNGSSATTEEDLLKIWQWVETLVIHGKPLDDYRKKVVSLILSRYLINIRKLDNEHAYQIIWEWLEKCAQLRSLKPSRSFFDKYVVWYQIGQARASGRPPMSFTTMQQKYPELYEVLMVYRLH